jgi:hypothetical protein
MALRGFEAAFAKQRKSIGKGAEGALILRSRCGSLNSASQCSARQFWGPQLSYYILFVASDVLIDKLEPGEKSQTRVARTAVCGLSLQHRPSRM